MPKMTAKYSGAVSVATLRNIDLSGDQEALYQRLQTAGFFWNSTQKTWEEHDPQDADPPTKLIMVRVWADAEIVEDAADDLISANKRRWELVERSTPYLCRPPKQAEARVYLKFLPRNK